MALVDPDSGWQNVKASVIDINRVWQHRSVNTGTLDDAPLQLCLYARKSTIDSVNNDRISNVLLGFFYARDNNGQMYAKRCIYMQDRREFRYLIGWIDVFVARHVLRRHIRAPVIQKELATLDRYLPPVLVKIIIQYLPPWKCTISTLIASQYRLQ